MSKDFPRSGGPPPERFLRRSCGTLHNQRVISIWILSAAVHNRAGRSGPKFRIHRKG
jgi:hypothetical protein